MPDFFDTPLASVLLTSFLKREMPFKEKEKKKEKVE